MRVAIIDLDVELLRDGLGPLLDAGLRVNCSLDSFGGYRFLVRLVVEGECLPEECERSPGDPVRRVRPLMNLETYGAQRLVRVASFELDKSFRFQPPTATGADRPAS